jgi:hypothetical protein
VIALRVTALRWVVATLVGICTVAGLAACGDGGGTPVREIRALELDAVPDQVLDLAVGTESVDAVKGARKPYIEAVGLYSLRRGELLQATLQVSRFHESADVDSAQFRGAVVRQIGATVPQRFQMGDDPVWLTAGRRQSIATWFRGNHVFVLATRDEYEQPRALLRELLEVEP